MLGKNLKAGDDMPCTDDDSRVPDLQPDATNGISSPDIDNPTAQKRGRPGRKKDSVPQDDRLLIPVRQMKALCAFLSSRHGLPAMHTLPEKAWRYDAHPLPVIRRNDHGTIWVDRDYIAYMLEDEVIRYAYVTAKNIREEQTCPGRPDYKLPKDVRQAFAAALRRMRRTGEPFCILIGLGGEKGPAQMAQGYGFGLI